MDRTITEIENSILGNDVESALNSIINGMKDMLRMIKLSLENSIFNVKLKYSNVGWLKFMV